MNNDLIDSRLSFRIFFIRVHGPKSNLTVRVQLVESTKAQFIYGGFGSLSQCEIWIAQLTGCIISRDALVHLRKCLIQGRMASIEGVRVSRRNIESIGLQRSDR